MKQNITKPDSSKNVFLQKGYEGFFPPYCCGGTLIREGKSSAAK
jgi:hypothetical protein